jgi:carbonic anhydrase
MGSSNQLATFRSNHNDAFLGTPPLWNATEFHWHSKSEHTIDGRQFDLEMHIVHSPAMPKGGNNNYTNAFLGVLFDTDPDIAAKFKEDEIKIVDDFFDSLSWGTNSNYNADE